MNDDSKNGLRRGCLAFIIALGILGAGAGISVLLKGKSMKPKSRAVVVGKPQARLEEIKKMLSDDMPPAMRDDFLKTFARYTEALEKHGSEWFDQLSPLGESIASIKADGVITPEEAEGWMAKVRQALGPG